MNVDEFEKYIANEEVQLLDVRTPEEYEEGHIAGSRNINVQDSTFALQIEETVDKKRPVAVYCRSGKRSHFAATLLEKKGYQVVNLEPGILGWMEWNKPIVK